MEIGEDLYRATERYLTSYLRTEAVIPGFQQTSLNGLRHIRYGRPKDGIEREVLLGARASDEALTILAQIPDLDDAFISVCLPVAEETERVWRAAGYALAYRNTLMTLDLRTVSTPLDANMREVDDPDGVAWLAGIRDDGEPRPAYLSDPAIRCFYLDIDSVPVVSAILVAVDGTTAVIDEVLTLPPHRRRGYASRLLGWLHAFAADTGATCIVLAATEAGRPLYRSLGYREVGDFTVWRGQTGTGS